MCLGLMLGRLLKDLSRRSCFRLLGFVDLMGKNVDWKDCMDKHGFRFGFY